MGLLDILNGMQNGPRGQGQPSTVDSSSGRGGGISPIMMALLGLLAYKALKGEAVSLPLRAGRAGLSPYPLAALLTPAIQAEGSAISWVDCWAAGRPARQLHNVPTGAKPGGSLSDLIPGGLGGLLGGAAAGSVLSGGLGNLIKELQEGGHGRVAQSWVGTGPNQDIAPQHLADALGSDTLDALSQHTGMGRADLLAGLSQHLPDLIDQLTPNGRLPSEEEAHRMV